LKIQKLFLINREVCKFNIIVIQKQDCNINILQTFNSIHNFFHLVRDSSLQARTCIYVNKYLKFNQWVIKIIELNICLIELQISNLKDEIQTLWLINIYNSCLLFIIFTEESFTISCLNELIKNDCKQLIIKDFNLHHLYWEDKRCFTHYIVTDVLLNIIINVKLKILLESDTITRKIHNQLTIINLAFDNEKIQFMIYKCKMKINLHEIWSFFNCHKVMFTHIFHAAYNSLIMKENEYRSTKYSFKNTSFHWLFSWWQDSDKWQSSWDHSYATKDHQEVYFLNKIVNSSMRLLKLNLLESRDKIMMTMNHMKIAKYFRSMKRLSEIQRLQKQDH